MELFGADFEHFSPEPSEPIVTPMPSATAPEKAKKGKIAAKATGHTYQFQIMESIGVSRAEIKKFADPLHWLTYFPPIAKACLLYPQLTWVVILIVSPIAR
jgi:leucyl-tRNA synthetase